MQKDASRQQAGKGRPQRREEEFARKAEFVVVTIPILSPLVSHPARFDCGKVFQVARVWREVPLVTIFRRLWDRSQTHRNFVMRLVKKNHISIVL